MKEDYTIKELARMSTPRLERLRMQLADHSFIWPQIKCDRILRDRDRKRQGQCTARIHHGPGHQSATYCNQVGKHTFHTAVYGSDREEAEWKGKDICSGYFDEPPSKDAIGKMELNRG